MDVKQCRYQQRCEHEKVEAPPCSAPPLLVTRSLSLSLSHLFAVCVSQVLSNVAQQHCGVGTDRRLLVNLQFGGAMSEKRKMCESEGRVSVMMRVGCISRHNAHRNSTTSTST